MMTKKVLIMLVFIAFLSCKEEDEVEKIHFNIAVKDFELKDRFINNNGDFPGFDLKFGGGSVTCANNTDTFFFDTEDASIENFLYGLPAGIYTIEIKMPPASLYGQNTPSFRSRIFDVEISDLTDTIEVPAEPTCALIVVKDDKNQLENGAFIIESHSLDNKDFIAYPLTLDTLGKTYYAFLTPDTVPDIPNAFLWFYGKEIGDAKDGLHTEVFEIGYKYLIKVLE